MGFPTISYFETPSLCTCHQEKVYSGYTCPTCKSLVCEIPRDCPICALTLVSAPSLARSYHHLFPPPEFESLLSSEQVIPCSTCLAPAQVQCTFCKEKICQDCETFIYDILHHCPSCLHSKSD